MTGLGRIRDVCSCFYVINSSTNTDYFCSTVLERTSCFICLNINYLLPCRLQGNQWYVVQLKLLNVVERCRSRCFCMLFSKYVVSFCLQIPIGALPLDALGYIGHTYIRPSTLARVGPRHYCYRIGPIRFLAGWSKRRPEPGLVWFR